MKDGFFDTVHYIVSAFCGNDGSFLVDEQFTELPVNELDVYLSSSLAPLSEKNVAELSGAIRALKAPYKVRFFFGQALLMHQLKSQTGDVASAELLRYQSRLASRMRADVAFSLVVSAVGAEILPLFSFSQCGEFLPPALSWLANT